MSDIRIIGIGSPFGNDITGWRAIDLLKTMLPSATQEKIELIASDRPGLNLIQMMQDTNIVILVDAILDADRHGVVIRLKREQLITPEAMLSSHHADVASALTLADKLQQLPQNIVLLGVGVDPSISTSLPEKTIQALANHIVAELEERLTTAVIH